MGRMAGWNAARVQEAQLLSLISKAARTKFGIDHSFTSIRSVSDFQKSVPLRSYEDFWTQYWKDSYPRLNNVTWPGAIPFFALSSGTTSGTTKYIPISHEMVASNSKAGLDLLVFHTHNRPKSRIFGGKSFMLGGSTDLSEPSPSIFAGDLSGIAVKTLPWWAKGRYFPPTELALLKNWEEKITILAERALKEDIRMIGGVPSWLLIFFGRVREIAPQGKKTIGEIFPNLEMLVHGGVNFSPYYHQFTELLEGSKAELREVYPASEGFIAAGDRGFGEGLHMMLDSGIFYEFVPVEELASPSPTRHWIENVETGTNYAIILTTCAGLWSYIIGDTVKFVDTTSPRILVTGRTSYSLSAFGEHLIGEEVEDAISFAAESISHSVVDYSVGAVYPSAPGELGGHRYFIEFQDRSPSEDNIARFTSILDKKLCSRNEDYEAHRAEGFGLKAPVVTSVPPGTFAAWMKSRGKLGGQNKVPRLISNRDLFENLVRFCDSAR